MFKAKRLTFYHTVTLALKHFVLLLILIRKPHGNRLSKLKNPLILARPRTMKWLQCCFFQLFLLREEQQSSI